VTAPRSLNEFERIVELLVRGAKALEHGQVQAQTATGTVLWAHVFELEPAEGQQVEVDPSIQTQVAQNLVWMRDVIVRSQELMPSTSAPSDLYENAFARALNATSPAHLGVRSVVIQQQLTLEAQSVLRMCAAQLLKDETELAAADLQALIEILEDLENGVAESDLPPDVKSFFYDQISIMRRAMREYPVRGAAAIRDGLHLSVGRWTLQGTALENAATKAAKPYWTRLRDSWGTFLALAKATETVSKALLAGYEIARLVPGLVDGGPKLLNK
jgi:hypothetical protein